jgi:23S rRNA pseudouridine2605 synthase
MHLEKMVYYAVNKPKGYVSTNHDPSGRPRVIDILPEVPERVYLVGRLDEDSTGLMILTNDGDLANRLAHPRYGVEKVYRALVAGTPGREIVTKLTEGIWLSDGKVRAKRARVVGTQGEATMLELVLAEGKKREIRRMLAKLGHKVMSLNRIAIGPVMLKGLSPGEYRPLARAEVALLRKVAAGIPISPPSFQARGETRRESPGPRRSPAKPGAEPSPAPRGRDRGRDHDRSKHHKKHPRPELRPRAKAQGRPSIAGEPVLERKPQPSSGGRERGPIPRPVPPLGRTPVRAPGGEPSGPPAAPSPPRGPRAGAGKVPPASPRPTRKIIGLHPKLAAESGMSMAGRPSRKRPMIKKRPPRRASGIKRLRGEGDEG